VESWLNLLTDLIVPGLVAAERASFDWASGPKGSTAQGAVAIASKYTALARSMVSPATAITGSRGCAT
jgi:hypothetical protein